MPLIKGDLEKIRKVVKSEVELGILKLEERIDKLEIENTKEHQDILQKISEIKTMGTEDFEVLNKDIIKLDKRVSKLEAKAI